MDPVKSVPDPVETTWNIVDKVFSILKGVNHIFMSCMKNAKVRASMKTAAIFFWWSVFF